ncbi:MAG: metallophosphoesterase [Phycisphaerales bacterium]|nr:metallophosphoesterase [Phycisphaerales bacterium]
MPCRLRVKPNPQFARALQRRPFEKLFLFSRPFNRILTASGKLLLSALIWPRFVAPFRWKLNRYPLPLAGLHPAFEGFKILHLSDLHVGVTRTSYLAQVFTRCLQENPDLIVITGDLIDYHPKALPLLKNLLQLLTTARPPHGILAIFGNHDYHEYSWRHVGPRSAHRAIHKRLVHLLKDMNIHLLRNEQYQIPSKTRNSKLETRNLTIVGLDEMWTTRADPAAAFANLTPEDPVICLQHNPDGVEFLKPFPWQFMLCGHSHGGQANFPLLGPLYLPMQHRHYLRGFYHFPPPPSPHRTMFVSTGLGYSTPIRLRCPPEANLFTLILR